MHHDLTNRDFRRSYIRFVAKVARDLPMPPARAPSRRAARCAGTARRAVAAIVVALRVGVIGRERRHRAAARRPIAATTAAAGTAGAATLAGLARLVTATARAAARTGGTARRPAAQLRG